MTKRHFPESELIINSDGSCFHLHLKPEYLADKVVLVGDPARVNTVAAHFDNIEHEVSSREFHTITGIYKGKRITCQSHGIGCDNIDIVVNELDTLANIDYNTREEKDDHRTLTMVRIGTCGGLQPFTPTGYGMFRSLGQEHWLRRTTQLLCWAQCGMRHPYGTRLHTAHAMGPH